MLTHDDLKFSPNGIAAFLKPTINEVAVDGPAREVVEQLERAGWDVPGIDVEFDMYGTGKNRYRKVRRVSGSVDGERFTIRYGRQQGYAPGSTDWYDSAAVADVVIPGRRVEMLENGGYVHTTCAIYVGQDWAADEERFHNGFMVNPRLNGEPRWYVKYKGGRGVLKPDSDVGREYTPQDDEPGHLLANEVHDGLAQWIEVHLLPHLRAQPDGTKTVEDHFPCEPTPYEGGLLYAIIEPRDAWRIKDGKAGEGMPEYHYALYGGWRLMDLGRSRDLPKVVEDGFTAMLFGDGSEPEFPGWLGKHWKYDARHVVRIDPKWSDGFWVVDCAAEDGFLRDLRRKRRQSDDPDLSRDLDSEEVWHRVASVARTLVPITEYDGSYRKPVVMCNREIGLDEVSDPVEIDVKALYKAGMDAWRAEANAEIERDEAEAAAEAGGSPAP